MEQILIFIKHHLVIIWRLIDWTNGKLFQLLFKSKLEKVLPHTLNEVSDDNYIYRELSAKDIHSLCNLISTQSPSDLKYFNPHGFDVKSINAQIKRPAFLMMGVFKEDKMIGYFFLRFFANKKCFVGRLIDKEFRRKGVGAVMNMIMYETAWKLGFRCLSTISRNNTAVMKAHAKNQTMLILKELQDNYLLVEFVREKAKN